MMKKQELIFGLHPVMEAIKGGKDIDKVLVQSDIQGGNITELRRLLKSHKISAQNLPLQRLNHLCKKNHQGVIAYVSPIEFQPYEEVLTKVFEAGRNPLFLILDRVSDVGNFGAICRSAECMGVDCVIIPVKGSAQINEESIKRSSGALMHINISRERDLAAVAKSLKGYGLSIIACSEKTDNLLHESNLTGACALVMGSEEDGINSQIMKEVDAHIAIPTLGETASLNVSVATGIALYELNRQRGSV